jgi:hypothetical protein
MEGDEMTHIPDNSRSLLIETGDVQYYSEMPDMLLHEWQSRLWNLQDEYKWKQRNLQLKEQYFPSITQYSISAGKPYTRKIRLSQDFIHKSLEELKPSERRHRVDVAYAAGCAGADVRKYGGDRERIGVIKR